MIFGVSFSPQYARYLGLDANKVYQSILDDWHFKYIRLSAQWDVIETTKGQYDFKELDYFMTEAGKRNAVENISCHKRKTSRETSLAVGFGGIAAGIAAYGVGRLLNPLNDA